MTAVRVVLVVAGVFLAINLVFGVTFSAAEIPQRHWKRIGHNKYVWIAIIVVLFPIGWLLYLLVVPRAIRRAAGGATASAPLEAVAATAPASDNRAGVVPITASVGGHGRVGPGALRLAGLSVQRGNRQVVWDVDLAVAPGEVTALLGPNGAGKSTLVLAVAGVLPKLAGSVHHGDADLSHVRPEAVRAAGVAAVPEGRRMLGELSVEDNLRVATYSLPADVAAAGMDDALELFPELQQRWGTAAKSLSGGEQQMVVLAQALVSKPDIILVDELSLGLAPIIVQRLTQSLEKIVASGVGVLLIEQFANVALGMAESAYVMEGGRIRYSGTAAELRSHPELLRSAYMLDATTTPMEPEVT